MSQTIDFGIDLGTTNSSIALCRAGTVRVFQNNDLMNVTPSVVHISKTGRVLVGKKAYDIWWQDPQNTQAEFKRWMGFSDRLTFPASGRVISAEELSAEVLKALRADAQRQTQEDVTAAVVTVPAAFGSLQCEATARAATLAGFEQASLLQEPIAAAIAYGAGPGTGNQRWMVFDLGGGTLDIAIVSTRNGRLGVLEHQGDNRLGGKDMDRLLAEKFLLEPLRQAFALPDRHADPQAFDRLHRALVRQAEYAKIALTTAPQVSVDLFDLGEDLRGKPIELTLSISRAELEAQIAPLIDRCLALAVRAMEGARLGPGDLHRVVLVGGPTQMPGLRAALQAGIGAPLEFALDPMTVVAQGAALYASSVQRAKARPAPTAGRGAAPAPAGGPAKGGPVHIELMYERASGAPQSPVGGVLPAGSAIHEVKIDAQGGFWTSGWVPVVNGRFMVDVALNDRKPATQFSVIARDKSGRPLPVEPGTFSITFMLPIAAPPLPHTIAVELVDHHGKTTYDPVFARNCPLPAEARRSYKADRTLRPSEVDTTLPIKFWEIEVSDDPQERWWAGCVHVRADKINRPIIEGSELALTIKIDTSRKMTVEVYVPLLDASFEHGVYIPDPPTARSQLQGQLDLCFERLALVRRLIYEADRDDLLDRAQQLQLRLEAIAEQFGERSSAEAGGDPDAALAPTDALRKIRIQLAQMEEQLEARSESALAREVRGQARWTEQLVEAHGTEDDRQQLAKLKDQLRKYGQADDPRGLMWVKEQLRMLREPILNALPEFWDGCLHYLKQPGRQFLNLAEARQWIEKAEAAQARRELPVMRDAVNHAWALLPPDKAAQAKEQMAQSGLRGSSGT